MRHFPSECRCRLPLTLSYGVKLASLLRGQACKFGKTRVSHHRGVIYPRRPINKAFQRIFSILCFLTIKMIDPSNIGGFSDFCILVPQQAFWKKSIISIEIPLWWLTNQVVKWTSDFAFIPELRDSSAAATDRAILEAPRLPSSPLDRKLYLKFQFSKLDPAIFVFLKVWKELHEVIKS